MKTLIVEDNAASRRLMSVYLSPYGECITAADGNDALQAFVWAREQGEPFDLICLDIMMPDMSGQELLKEIRKLEEEDGILPPASVKVIMTSALNDSDNIMGAFLNQCEAYIVKPVEQEKLLEQIRLIGIELH